MVVMKRLLDAIICLVCGVVGIVIGFMATTFIVYFIRMVYHF